MEQKKVQAADVVRAYVSLLKQRRSPSLLNIRLELGRGSFATIATQLERLSLVREGRRFRRTNKRGRPRRPMVRDD
ncbi:MAG: hypothetical protein ACK53K_03880 [Burkholderiales bacterium]|jgi:hypothetical protein